MNEVTQIHLGRQAFTVSAAAHKELRTYLDAITKQVDDTDVVDEVELRMAELLNERGVTGDKVILQADVKYLKKQLGDPKDFKEDGDAPKNAPDAASERRLFRDTHDAMFAGVSSGLSAYFGVDIWLVRVAFIIATIAWGIGIPIYIVLWLLVPEAKTASDRLQMVGKPITVDGLKEVVERADLKGAAHRAGDTLSGPAATVRDIVNKVFGILVKIIGVAMTMIGLLIITGLAFTGVYLLAHGNIVADNIFPVGFKEHLFAYLTAFVAAMVGIFIILFGMAVFARKWPIRGWLTGVLVGLTLIGAVCAGALAADTIPTVRDRYNSHLHTVTRQLKPFTGVNVKGQDVTINFQASDKYYVSLKYFDNANVGAIKTNVNNGTLVIDSTNFPWHRVCDKLCLPDNYNMVITVYSPNQPRVDFADGSFGQGVFMGPNYAR
jgi:phage shock protein PspC (stress-responsive transcriptional regulator)/anti-sigma28 factor (negative regulator of flagellin synthesis)